MFVLRQLKHEIHWKSVNIPFHLLIESSGLCLIKFCEIIIQHDLVISDQIDLAYNEFIWYQHLGGANVIEWLNGLLKRRVPNCSNQSGFQNKCLTSENKKRPSACAEGLVPKTGIELAYRQAGPHIEGHANHKSYLEVPKAGIEPAHPRIHDFESCASTSSATLAINLL